MTSQHSRRTMIVSGATSLYGLLALGSDPAAQQARLAFISDTMQGAMQRRDTAPDPDAELLATFKAWREAAVTADNLPDTMPEAERDLYWRPYHDLMRKMDATPAHTPAGVAAKARYQFASVAEDKPFFDWAIYGKPIDPAELPDRRAVAFLGLLQDIERLAGGEA